MRLRARVDHNTGATRHYRAHVDRGEVHRDEVIPPPSWVEIRDTDGAFFLLYLDDQGETQTDTWHRTVEDAKAQALHEFGIKDGEWKAVDAA